MKPQLDSARKAFQEDLGQRASRKRIRALAAANREAKAPEEKPEKASVVGLLKEILEFLKGYKAADSGSVEFVVTERGADGKIKSFKVES